MEYDQDEFYDAVQELAKIDGVEVVLSIPGVSELVIEYYNNAAIERLDKEREQEKEQEAQHAAAVEWHAPDYKNVVNVFHRRFSDSEYLAVVKRAGSTKPWKLFRAGDYMSSFTTAARTMAAGDRLIELETGQAGIVKTNAQYEEIIARIVAEQAS